jgi:hypothetical protein
MHRHHRGSSFGSVSPSVSTISEHSHMQAKPAPTPLSLSNRTWLCLRRSRCCDCGNYRYNQWQQEGDGDGYGNGDDYNGGNNSDFGESHYLKRQKRRGGEVGASRTTHNGQGRQCWSLFYPWGLVDAVLLLAGRYWVLGTRDVLDVLDVLDVSHTGARAARAACPWHSMLLVETVVTRKLSLVPPF